MKKTLIIVALLAGCAENTQPQPDYIEVKIPVPVPCKTDPVAVPAFAVDQLPLGSSIDVQMRALRAERHQRKGYERKLVAANEACR